MALVMFIVGVITPFAFSSTATDWVFFTLVAWFYLPSLLIEPGSYVLYLPVLYGFPGVYEFWLFVYTIIGRLCYPYQVRRHFLGKSTIRSTLMIGLLIDLPIVLSVYLIMPVYPLPSSTLAAAALILLYSETHKTQSHSHS
jgi:hypothetical protein